MIEYTNISYEEYLKLSNEEIIKPYCIKYDDGTKEWVVNGLYHRENGPAELWPNKTEFWFINGELHRKDGPAVKWLNGTINWYLNGKQYTFKEWFELTPISDEEKVFLRLKYP